MKCSARALCELNTRFYASAELLLPLLFYALSTGQGLGAGAPVDPTASAAVGSNLLGTNALLAYTAMDANPLRLAMLPYLQNFGPVASSYFARGGFDKFYNALMSDAINNMLSQSMGVSPLVSSFLTNNIVDTPDKYIMTNLLLGNRRPGAVGDAGSNSNRISPLGLALLSGMS